MKISIIVPAHNEEENIAQVIGEIEKNVLLDHELLVVNDHSQDSTAQIIQGLRASYGNLRLVENKRDKGFTNALKTGFELASGELIVPVMADLCDDPRTIARMHEKILEGNDLVCASRYIKGGARLGGSKIKGFFSGFAGWSLYYLLGVPTHDIANAFKMYKTEIARQEGVRAMSFEISMELTLRAYYAGYKIAEVPTVWRERKKGKSNFKIFKLLPNYLRLYFWAIIKRMSR